MRCEGLGVWGVGGWGRGGGGARKITPSMCGTLRVKNSKGDINFVIVKTHKYDTFLLASLKFTIMRECVFSVSGTSTQFPSPPNEALYTNKYSLLHGEGER